MNEETKQQIEKEALKLYPKPWDQYARYAYIQGREDGYKLANQWVKCSDRMPSDDLPVMCFNMYYSDFSVCVVENGLFVSCETDNIINVTHWIPLPNPPKK